MVKRILAGCILVHSCNALAWGPRAEDSETKKIYDALNVPEEISQTGVRRGTLTIYKKRVAYLTCNRNVVVSSRDGSVRESYDCSL